MNGKLIAETILSQLGGSGRLGAMIGAKNFSYDKDGSLSFHFKGFRKANILKISLNSMDLYDVQFLKYSPKKMECNEYKMINGVYCDMLKEIIEGETGLYLSL